MEDHRRFELRPQGLRVPRSTVDASGPLSGEPGRSRTSCRWVKRPVPGRTGYEGSGSLPRLPSIVVMAVSVGLVIQSGIEPVSCGYRPQALPLSYWIVNGRSRRNRTHSWEGVGLLPSHLARDPGLRDRESGIGDQVPQLAPFSRCCPDCLMPDAWYWCARQDSNLHCTLSERVASCRLGYWRFDY